MSRIFIRSLEISKQKVDELTLIAASRVHCCQLFFSSFRVASNEIKNYAALRYKKKFFLFYKIVDVGMCRNEIKREADKMLPTLKSSLCFLLIKIECQTLEK